MVVAGVSRASNLIVERQNDVLSVGHHEWFHAVEDITFSHDAQLSMTLCIEQKGILPQAEMLEQIKRLKMTQARGQWPSGGPV